MAFNSIITHAYDLTGPLRITPLSHSLVSGDDKGDRFEVSVLSGGAPVPLTGGSVMGYFIREGDGATIPITGTASGNVASVVLPEACYVVTGRFSLVIKVSLGGARHAVYACEGAVLRSMTDSIVDPGHNIPDLQELLALIDQMEQATTKANTATSKANTASASAEAATKQANAAAKEAEEQTARAQRAADEAEAARHVADRAADDALEAADKANSAAERVDAGVAAAEAALEEAHTAANRTDEALGLAQRATEEAAGAADRASAAGDAADNAAAHAMEAASVAEKWGSVTVTVEMLDPDADPVITVTDTETGKRMEFQLPRGLTGLTPDITIGEVLTGEPGSDVQAWFTGTTEKRVLNLSIPRGAVGEVQNLTICGKSPDAGGELTLTAEDVGALPADGAAADSKKLDGQLASYYLTHFNLLDNSDFTALIAQAGIGGTHGTQAYAADRWKLMSGTISYEEGVGLTLDGEIAQIVGRDIPADRTVVLHMASGDAVWSIDDNTIKVTSSGGVIRDIALYASQIDGDVQYHPKGYAAELAECQRYYENSWYGHNSGVSATNEYLFYMYSTSNGDCPIDFKVAKRAIATITFYPGGNNSTPVIYNGTYFQTNVSSMSRDGVHRFLARITKHSDDTSTWVAGRCCAATFNWEASADLLDSLTRNEGW